MLSVLLALSLQNGKPGGASFPWDPISETHIESVLKKHHAESQSMLEAASIYFVFVMGWNSPGQDLEAILKKEAPHDEYGGPEPDLKDPRWIQLTTSQRSGLAAAPFPIMSFYKATKIDPSHVSQLVYRPRKYLGPDLAYHTGFSVHVYYREPDGPPYQRITIMDNGTLPKLMPDKVNSAFSQVVLVTKPLKALSHGLESPEIAVGLAKPK